MTTAASPAALLETHFGTLKDPRSPSQIEHKLIDILIITICATICGANDWEAIAEYGRTKQDWLKTWLELSNGIPSPDTFSRVLARIKPTELQKCFMGWMSAVAEVTEGELLNIIAELLSVKGLVRQIYQKVNEAVGVRINLLDIGVEELKQKIPGISPEFNQLIEIRDGFKNQIRTNSEHYANELANDFCNYLSNLDSTFEADFAPYQPDLKVFDLLKGGKKQEFQDNLEQAFNRYSNDKMATWTKRAEEKLKEAFTIIAESAESYGDAYSQVTDKIAAKLSEQKIQTGTVSAEDKSPGWTRWAGAAAGIFLGNPAGAALVGFGALDWKSLVGQFIAAVAANIVLLYAGGSFLGPIGIGLVALVTGGVQLQLAKNKLTKLAKDEMRKQLPNIANAEKIKVYSFVKDIFSNFEYEVTQRIDSDILSRKAELEDLLAQKASQEIDKTVEISRLNTLDREILNQRNEIEAIADKFQLSWI